MRSLFIFIFVCTISQSYGQKYILLDKAISQPAFYANKILVSDKYKGFFPVEKKDLPKFLEILEEISQRLSSPKITGKVKNYKLGCLELNGVAFPLASGERLDYVLTSTCDNIKITMHLCDAKLSSEDNAYFINTWIKYIKNAQKLN